MPSKLPPLNALRAFEASARQLSFTRAADELAVTQTAVSHQIRGLEQWLGRAVFKRQGRNIELTEGGQILYPVVTEAFARIADAVAQARAVNTRPTLTVSVTPTFGSRWLAQRLGRFWREQPELDLRVHHSLQLADIARENIDIGIRWGRGEWPGIQVERLLHAYPTPICSPALMQGDHGLQRPQDLASQTLLHEQDYHEWTEWLMAAGYPEVNGQRGPIIDDPNALVRATIKGHGVMMGITSLLSDEIEAGQLIAPFENEEHPEFGYYMVYTDGALEQPKVRAFRDFLLEEVGNLEDGER